MREEEVATSGWVKQKGEDVVKWVELDEDLDLVERW